MNETERRKLSHIEVCLSKDVQNRSIKTGFDDVSLIHKSTPEVDFRSISTSTSLFRHKLLLPIVIAGMTGGTAKAAKLNGILAQAAEKFKIGMGVGSQRAALEKKSLAYTFSVVRDKAPTAFLIANIGCSQLLEEGGIEKAREAVEMIEADALAVHLNPLQEIVQFEGQANFKGVIKRLKELTGSLEVPILAKEVGAGISLEVAMELEVAGVRGLDIGGAGGTSWSAVEYHRAEMNGDEFRQRIGKTFWDWGIPTAISLVESRQSTKLPLIATGGVRTGLDIAKAIALGADACGIAYPLLKAATKGLEAVSKEIGHVEMELRTALFLTGCSSVQELAKSPVIITGKAAEWLSARGINTSEYARRGE